MMKNHQKECTSFHFNEMIFDTNKEKQWQHLSFSPSFALSSIVQFISALYDIISVARVKLKRLHETCASNTSNQTPFFSSTVSK